MIRMSATSKSADASAHLVMPEDHMDELYTSPNPLVRFVHTQRLDAIADCIPQADTPKRLDILDAGCGEGHLIEVLHRRFSIHRYYGADITPIALEKAAQRCPYATLKRTELSKLSFADASMDVVTCTEVLEHITHYEDVLREFVRVLRKDELLILTFPNETLWTFSRLLLGRRPIKVPDHVNSFSPHAMRRVVEGMGLQLVQQKNLPYGLPFAASLNGLLVFKKTN
jgi:2-polyprenyl-3-methyl-5-hydroxy-6-metoxy-1,4-benzoquinol methylase